MENSSFYELYGVENTKNIFDLKMPSDDHKKKLVTMANLGNFFVKVTYSNKKVYMLNPTFGIIETTDYGIKSIPSTRNILNKETGKPTIPIPDGLVSLLNIDTIYKNAVIKVNIDIEKKKLENNTWLETFYWFILNIIMMKQYDLFSKISPKITIVNDLGKQKPVTSNFVRLDNAELKASAFKDIGQKPWVDCVESLPYPEDYSSIIFKYYYEDEVNAYTIVNNTEESIYIHSFCFQQGDSVAYAGILMIRIIIKYCSMLSECDELYCLVKPSTVNFFKQMGFVLVDPKKTEEHTLEELTKLNNSPDNAIKMVLHLKQKISKKECCCTIS
jgi:hypothetical protein